MTLPDTSGSQALELSATIREVPPYPGANAKVGQLVRLADEYFHAAHLLVPQCDPKSGPEASAPARLCAIQAIELYLSAFLRFNELSSKDIRAHGHNLASRLELACEMGLNLKIKTREHVLKLNEQRDYLKVRYGPEQLGDLSQVNRMFATLKEVSIKVRTRVFNQPYEIGDPRFKQFW